MYWCCHNSIGVISHFWGGFNLFNVLNQVRHLFFIYSFSKVRQCYFFKILSQNSKFNFFKVDFLFLFQINQFSSFMKVILLIAITYSIIFVAIWFGYTSKIGRQQIHKILNIIIFGNLRHTYFSILISHHQQIFWYEKFRQKIKIQKGSSFSTNIKQNCEFFCLAAEVKIIGI